MVKFASVSILAIALAAAAPVLADQGPQLHFDAPKPETDAVNSTHVQEHHDSEHHESKHHESHHHHHHAHNELDADAKFLGSVFFFDGWSSKFMNYVSDVAHSSPEDSSHESSDAVTSDTTEHHHLHHHHEKHSGGDYPAAGAENPGPSPSQTHFQARELSVDPSLYERSIDEGLYERSVEQLFSREYDVESLYGRDIYDDLD